MAEQALHYGAAQRNLNSAAARSALSPRRHRRTAGVMAILCACMVMFATTLLLAHNHTTAEQRSGHCEICFSIHTAMPAVSLPVLFTAQAAPEPVVTTTPEAPTLLRVETRSTRAPPTAA